MVRYLQAYHLDLLVGRREQRKDSLLVRLIPCWIANRLIAKVTGINIRDNGCSLKVYRASIITRVRLMGEMHRFIPAWVAANSSESRIGEIDVRHHARQFGTSKYGISRTIRVCLDLLAVTFLIRFHARPGHFFGTAGMIASFLALTAIVSHCFLSDRFGFQTPLLCGVMAMVTCVQLIAMGVMAEMVSRIYHDSASHPSYVIGQTHRANQTSDARVDDEQPSVIPFVREVDSSTQRRAG